MSSIKPQPKSTRLAEQHQTTRTSPRLSAPQAQQTQVTSDVPNKERSAREAFGSKEADPLAQAKRVNIYSKFIDNNDGRKFGVITKDEILTTEDAKKINSQLQPFTNANATTRSSIAFLLNKPQ